MVLQKFKLIFVIIASVTLFSACKSHQTASSNREALNGVWVGQAYQHDIEDSWDIKFVCNTYNNEYVIEYPSLGCAGSWDLLQYDKNSFVFRETLNKGNDICTNSGKVVLKRNDAGHIEFYYYWPDEYTLNASGRLTKSDSI